MILETYQNIIKELKNGHRPRIKASGKLLELLEESLNHDNKEIDQVICILCHLSRPEEKFTPQLLNLLHKNLPIETQIFILEAITKHALDSRMISGNRLSPEFLSKFAKYIIQAPKGVLPFAIGIVEGCGSQGIYFRQCLKELKWSFLDAFKKESRETISRIETLESNWQKLVK